MLNLIAKASVTTLVAVSLVGGLSAQAHAQSAMPIIAAASAPTQQTGFTNNAALENIRVNRNQLQSRRRVNGGLGNLGFKSSDFGQNNFGQSSFGDHKFGQSEFDRRQFGQDRIGQSGFSNRNRQFSPAIRFSSHINSEQNFKTAKVLTSRF